MFMEECYILPGKKMRNLRVIIFLVAIVLFYCEGKKLPLPTYTPDIRGNTSPVEPYEPIPADGSTDQPVNLTLSWKCYDPEDDLIKYDVYFGTDTSVLELIAENNPDTFCVLDSLENETKYYWKVNAKDLYGMQVLGPIWSFITISKINNPPQVFIDNPADGSSFYRGEMIDFTGHGIDPEDGNLPDTSLYWSSDINGFLHQGSSFSINTLKAGTHTITLKGKDSKGVESTVQIQITIMIPPPTPPTVEIKFPSQDYMIFLEGQNINFQAEGYDPYETLLDSVFAWSSDIDGFLGNGKNLSVNSLHTGTHHIILTVTDGEGFQVSDTVIVSIASPTNQVPEACFYFTNRVILSSGSSGKLVTLDAGYSYDSEDQNNLLFKWDLNNDGIWDTEYIEESVISFELNLSNDVNYVKLLVRDQQGGMDSTLRIVPEMVYIPAGSFIRGSDPDEGNPDERPEKEISISDFYIDKFEVTNAQYTYFLNDGNSEHYYFEMKIEENSSGKFMPVKGWENFPVSYINWFDAKAYLIWLSKKTGLNYRLPTEAEWEKAARGGIYLDSSGSVSNPLPERIYPWGNNFETNIAHYSGNLSEFPTTAPSGYYNGKSPYGVFDLAGNVSEWVSDWYSDKYYSTAQPIDPEGPETGFYRVIRGGSFESDADQLRVAKRESFLPGMRGATNGFRCVLKY
ncbi:hypothetical protein DRQ09_10000 [candidate division KSB1 bacterium]|nr:MAG: hypothetical protein DRQ09_10000 [candidate division KSB1 bacterium]